MRETLPALLMLCRREFDLATRAPAFRWPCLILLLLAAAVGASSPRSAAMGVYAAYQIAGPWFGFLALFWATMAAARDRWGRTEPLILAKPVIVQGLVAARFLGSLAATTLGLILVLAAGALGHVLASMFGTGSPGQAAAGAWKPLLLAPALLVPAALPGMFYLAALGFTLSLLLRSPLAAAAAGLYWVLVLLAGDYVARVFNMTLPQNGPIYTWAGLGVVLLGVLLYRRADRARVRWSRLLTGATVATFAAALVTAVDTVRHSHDVPLRHDDLSLAIMSQSAHRQERAPGFWLPDQHGEPYGLHRAEGRILVLAFWSPEAPESVPALEALAEVQQEFGARGVQPVAVCLTEDHRASPFFARVDGRRFPMVTDTGTRWTPQLEDTSPVGAAYEIKGLPVIVFTDRERRIRQIWGAEAPIDKERMRLEVHTLLRAEPE